MAREKPKIAGIILAAGMGLRMGTTKQLLPTGEIPMLQKVINIALESQLDSVTVVLGHDIAKIRKKVNLSKVTVVENPHYDRGQSTSLKAGIGALSPDVDAALFLLADQPLVDVETINRLVHAYHLQKDLILRPVYDKKPGNPVLMGRCVFPQLADLTGDMGGRAIFSQFAENIREVPVRNNGIHIDLDTREDYQAFLAQTEGALAQQKLLDVLRPEQNSVISVVGAGGKTTTLFALSRELKEIGSRVLVTTTTAMFHPDRDGWPYDRLLLTRNADEIAPPDSLEGSVTVAAAIFDRDSNKIMGYTPETIDSINQQGRFDIVLVEADGSKNRPIKAPGPHEPVIPLSTSIVIGMIGLNALENPINYDHVHRPELLAEVARASMDSAITETEFVNLILHPSGLFKNSPPTARQVVILNQADTPGYSQTGRQVAKLALRKASRLEMVLITEMQKPMPVLNFIKQ